MQYIYPLVCLHRRRNRPKFINALLAFVLVLSAPSVFAQTSTVNIFPSKDNTIYQKDQSNSNGAGEFILAGVTGMGFANRALLKFDVAGSIPAGATILDVSLSVHVSLVSGTAPPTDFELHKLTEEWGEGTSNAGPQAGLGVPATTNDATWINAFHPATPWSTPGGTFDAAASEIQTIAGVGSYAFSSVSGIGISHDVQEWVDSPGKNHGWIMRTDESMIFSARRFDSRENGTVANRPVLTITYTLVAPNKTPAVSFIAPSPDTIFNAPASITLQALAHDSDGTVSHVTFYLISGGDAIPLGDDINNPYMLTGNGVESGVYRVIAKATDNDNAVGVSDTLTVTVAGCTGSGALTAYGYTNIPGTGLISLASDASYPGSPTIITQVTKFEYGPNLGDNYGGKLRGYICAPVTGNYTFYIASDDQSELWLSTDESQFNIQRIAYVESLVPFRSYFAVPTQISLPIPLIKGARYYVETVHKEGTNQDHLSVAWRIPGGAFEGPIPGTRLSPYNGPGFIRANGSRNFEEAIRNSQIGLLVTVLPNPSVNTFTIKTRSSSETQLSLTVTDVLGRVVERKSVLPANGTFQVGEHLGPGMYIMEVIQGKEKRRIKLIRQ